MDIKYLSASIINKGKTITSEFKVFEDEGLYYIAPIQNPVEDKNFELRLYFKPEETSPDHADREGYRFHPESIDCSDGSWIEI